MTSPNQEDEFCFIEDPQSQSQSPLITSHYSPQETEQDRNMFQICENQLKNADKYLCIDVGFKNLSWCVLENSENSLNKIIHEHGVQSIYSKKANSKIDWEEVNMKLYTLFQEDFPILWTYQNELKGIYIERQPKRNTNACLLGATIYTFFYNQMKNIQREGRNLWFNIPIEYMDSRKKLSPDTLLFLDISSLTIPKNYYQRKT